MVLDKGHEATRLRAAPMALLRRKLAQPVHAPGQTIADAAAAET